MIEPHHLPNFSHILALWKQAWENTESMPLDGSIFKHVTEVKNYDDINKRFRELLSNTINQNLK